MECRELGQNQECLNQLIETFGLGVHTESSVIEKAFKVCRDNLIAQFKKESKNITNIETAKNFMNTYCVNALRLEQGNMTEKEILYCLDVKKLSKNIFSELTNLDLYNNQTIQNQDVLNNLFRLSNALSYLSQNHYTFYLSGNEGFQIEIYNDWFSFTMNDESLAQKNYSLADQIPYDYFKGSVEKPERIKTFMDKTIEVYGKPASELYECFQPELEPSVIIELSFLYNRYPNNNFLQGWVLKPNEASLLQSYKSPHKAERSRNRPILQLHVDNKICYFTTPYIFCEAIYEIVFNQLPFNIKPKEWDDRRMINFANIWKDEHDSWLDDEVQKVLENAHYLFLRNKKAIDGIDLIHEKSAIPSRNVGEIDFVIIDKHNKLVYVTDTKYMRTKFDFASFSSEMSKFTQDKNNYNGQLSIKYNWVKTHLPNIQREIKIKIDVTGFSVRCFFITNAPSFYRFYSQYPIIPVDELISFLRTKSESISFDSK